MASDLPKITKTQALQILRESIIPGGSLCDGIVARCNTSEDLWNMLKSVIPNPSMEVITRVLEGGKKKSTKKKKKKTSR
jgi:hypothetical protein